ncbi:hypothetical protein KIPB_012477, partial [Kipferlia bialata]
LYDAASMGTVFEYKADWQINSGQLHPKAGLLALGGGMEARDVTQTEQTEDCFAILIYDAVQGTLQDLIGGHIGPIHSLAWSPNGTALVTGSEDGAVMLTRFDEIVNKYQFK